MKLNDDIKNPAQFIKYKFDFFWQVKPLIYQQKLLRLILDQIKMFHHNFQKWLDIVPNREINVKYPNYLQGYYLN